MPLTLRPTRSEHTLEAFQSVSSTGFQAQKVSGLT